MSESYILSETYLVDERDLGCSTVTWMTVAGRWSGQSQRAEYQALEGSRKVSRKRRVWEQQKRGREPGIAARIARRAGGAAVRPKVDTMVWSKSFGVSDMRDKQGVPCNLPEALLRNPNCWPPWHAHQHT